MREKEKSRKKICDTIKNAATKTEWPNKCARINGKVWDERMETRECHRVKDLQCYINECFHSRWIKKMLLFHFRIVSVCFFSVSRGMNVHVHSMLLLYHWCASAILAWFCIYVFSLQADLLQILRPKIQTDHELNASFLSFLVDSFHSSCDNVVCHVRCVWFESSV